MLSPRPCIWDVKGHGTVFHLRNVSVYIVSLWGKESHPFSWILIMRITSRPRSQLQDSLSIFLLIGGNGVRSVVSIPGIFYVSLIDNAGFHVLWLHSFMFLRPLPPTGQSAGLWVSFGNCDFCGTDFSYIWGVRLSNYGKCLHLLWEKSQGNQQYATFLFECLGKSALESG